MSNITFTLSNDHPECANIVASIEQVDALIGFLRMVKGDITPDQWINLVRELWPLAASTAGQVVQTCAALIGAGL